MDDTLSLVYGALAHPARRDILERLARGECTVAELRRPLTMSAAAVSKHLRVLTTAGLIERRPAGRHQVCRLRGDSLGEAGAWCDQQRRFWTESLDSFEAYLEDGEP